MQEWTLLNARMLEWTLLNARMLEWTLMNARYWYTYPLELRMDVPDLPKIYLVLWRDGRSRSFYIMRPRTLNGEIVRSRMIYGDVVRSRMIYGDGVRPNSDHSVCLSGVLRVHSNMSESLRIH